jgi:hypothetical protein
MVGGMKRRHDGDSIACEPSDEDQAFVYLCLRDSARICYWRRRRHPCRVDAPGTAPCAALAAAMFARVTALTTAYDAGSAGQPAHCVVRGSAAPRTGADGPKLKHPKERISPSLLVPNFTDIAAAQRGLSLKATPRR